jgi:hypothetical protein
MATKQLPPTRLDEEALAIIKKYQDQLAAKENGYVRVYPSKAVKHMEELIQNRESLIAVNKEQQHMIEMLKRDLARCNEAVGPVGPTVERVAKRSGGKTSVSLPIEMTGKTLIIAEKKVN